MQGNIFLYMKKKVLSYLFTLLLLFGCSMHKEIVPNIESSDSYLERENILNSSNWSVSIKKLEELHYLHPLSPYAKQIQLDLIYAYYRNNDLTFALANIKRFSQWNSAHEKMDWVLYMQGLTHMKQDKNKLYDFFRINRSDRDTELTNISITDFKQLLERYPTSSYAKDAKRYIFELENRLAEHHLAIAYFYLKRRAWIAAINRTQKIQNKYPHNKRIVKESLKIQLQAYQKLRLKTAIENTKKLIKTYQ
ncbi:lipoprotein [Candidatus Photodesmus katoptron Akat1]|uniref:Outer membrane protein assembly factor BamD n=2 Tax=Candidatus Photodesmus anomalopis TaxID=28176 RepID=S3EGP8_9GAMM|nr:lipoprotein [Candidatus Photodesmus katoptron Akat1]